MTVASGTTEALIGSIERVTFHNPDNGFGPLRPGCFHHCA